MKNLTKPQEKLLLRFKKGVEMNYGNIGLHWTELWGPKCLVANNLVKLGMLRRDPIRYYITQAGLDYFKEPK